MAENCIIHVCLGTESKLIDVSDVSWEKIRSFAREWSDLVPGGSREEQAAANRILSRSYNVQGKKYHASCYSRFCNKSYLRRFQSRNAAKEEADPQAEMILEEIHQDQGDSSKRATRSSTAQAIPVSERPHVLPAVCLICRKKTKYISRRSQTLIDKLRNVETTDGGKLRQAAEDLNREDILLQIRGKDLVAIEAKYHDDCYKKLQAEAAQQKTVEELSSDPVLSDRKLNNLFESFCDEVMSGMVASGRPIPLSSLHAKFLEMAAKLGYNISETYKSGRLKKRLSARYPMLKFFEPNNRKESHIVYTSSASPGKLLQHVQVKRKKLFLEDISSSGTDTDMDTEGSSSILSSPVKAIDSYTSELHPLFTQCLALREELRRAPDLLQNIWPPTHRELSVGNVEDMIPMTLFNAMAWILNLSDEPTIDSYVDVDDQSRLKLLSLLQDMINLHSKGKKIPPKHYCLAMAIRHLTGSTRVIKLLNHFGHCCARATCVSHETSLAQAQVNRCSIVPDGFQKGKFATVVADNIDFQEATISGQGTSHYTNSILIQRNPHDSDDVILHDRSCGKKRVHTLELEPSDLIAYEKRPRLGPQASASNPTANNSKDQSSASTQSMRADTLYFLIKSVDDKNLLDNWTGYNTRLRREEVVTRDKIGYLPVIAASATDYDTIHSLMLKVLEIADELEIPSIVLVCDLAVYQKVQEIRWAQKNSQFHGRIVVRPGEFHTIMAYLGALGKKYGSAGLKDMLIQSGVVAQGSINGVISGKAYNRAMLAHKVTVETLEFFRFQSFLKSTPESEGEQILKHLKRLAALYPSLMFTIEIEGPFTSEIIKKYEAYCKERESDNTFMFWSSYIREAKILLEFVRASRTGNFESHLFWLDRMVPLFFSMDRTHYARYMPAYLQEMRALTQTHPFVDQHLRSGQFVAQRTEKYGFSGVPHDQTIEQTLNREVKVSGGMIGITLNHNALQRWILSQPERALITKQCEAMAGLGEDHCQRKDLLESTKIRDCSLVDRMIETIEDVMIDPFGGGQTDLIHIVSGVSADSAVADDLLSAYERGDEAYKSFASSIQEDETAIFRSIKQLNLRTFTTATKKKRVDKKGAQMSDRKLFTRFILLGKQLNLNLRDLLSYPLGTVSYPLATTDGSIAKTQKSRLLQLVEVNWPLEAPTPPQGGAYILDAMAFVHSLNTNELPNSMGALAAHIFRKMTAIARHKKASRVDIVMDRYPEISIKSPEHERRGNLEESLSFGRIRPEMPVPRQLKRFLAGNKSKNTFIEFLVEEWLKIESVFTVYFAYENKCVKKCTSGDISVIEELTSNHSEADTRLILHAHHAAAEHNNVVIITPDSDVIFITLAATQFFPDLCSILIQTCGKKNRSIPITELHKAMGVIMAKALLGYHVFTGCDSVSSFNGKGKAKGFHLLKNSLSHQEVFSMLGSSFELERKLFPGLQKFVCELYGHKCDTVNEARYISFCTTTVDESRLPPCEDSLWLHSSRAAYQCAINRLALERNMDVPSPNGHGWIVDDKKLAIQWSSVGPAPQEIVSHDRCMCKTGCGTKRCACNKASVQCTDLCGCSGCENLDETSIEREIIDDDNEYVDDEELSDDDF